MSDHQFRAKAHGSADNRAQSTFHLPDLADPSSFGANMAQLRGGASWQSTTFAKTSQVNSAIRLIATNRSSRLWSPWAPSSPLRTDALTRSSVTRRWVTSIGSSWRRPSQGRALLTFSTRKHTNSREETLLI